MKIPVIVLALLILTGCRTARLVPASELSGHRMNASVLLVTTAKDIKSVSTFGKGTATVVRWGGRLCVVTAWHVVSSHQEHRLFVSGNGHSQWVGPFKKIDGRDLAWTELPNMPPVWSALEVAGNNNDHGACSVWGFPYNAGALASFRCQDSGWVKLGDDKVRWLAGAAIPGMSGGPVVDDDSRVIGVVSHSERPYNKYFYAAPVCDIAPLITTRAMSYPAIPAPPPISYNPEPVPTPESSKIESSADLGAPAWAR